MTALTAGQEQGLRVARDLVAAGVPLFLAYPSADHAAGYAPPQGWQHSVPDLAVVDRWRPGLALCMLTGCGLDLIDLDAHKDCHPEDLPTGIDRATVAVASTPSGGRHYFVPSLGVASRDGTYRGIDVKAGAPDGTGRGFAFLAPTVRASKRDGLPGTYRWDWVSLPTLAQFRTEGTPPPARLALDAVRARIEHLRESRQRADRSRRVPASTWARECREAVDRLEAAVRHHAAHGWGGEAHADLLAATTHMARLDAEHAEDGFYAAFLRAGVEPDDNDLQKLSSAVSTAVPDVVVPDALLSPQELFWAGASVPTERMPPDPSPPPATPAPVAARAYREREGFDFYTEHELEQIPEPERLIEGLLWTNTVARMFGPSTVGKTFVALDKAAHVACGISWQGREVKQVPVLYVAAEGAPGIRSRLAAWRSRHGRDSQVMVWPEAVLVGGERWVEFVAAVVAGGFGYVQLDTQAAMTVGYNENSNSDMAVVLAHLAELRAATGACVELVHHTGHEETDRARGASGAFGGLDTELRLESDGRSRHAVRLVQTKQKYAERGKPTRLVLERHEGSLVIGSGAEAAALESEQQTRDRVNALVAVLQTDHADPGKSMRHLVGQLRDLGHSGDSEVLRDAVREFWRLAGRQVADRGGGDLRDLIA